MWRTRAVPTSRLPSVLPFPFNSLIPGPLGLFPEGFRVYIPVIVTVSCMVPCGGASVPPSRAVTPISFQRHMNPRKDGVVSRVAPLLKLAVLPNFRHPIAVP